MTLSFFTILQFILHLCTYNYSYKIPGLWHFSLLKVQQQIDLDLYFKEIEKIRFKLKKIDLNQINPIFLLF